MYRVVTLERLGWDAEFDTQFVPFSHKGLLPARVAVTHNYLYQLCTADAVVMAEVAGRLRHHSIGPEGRPVVGDWVALRLAAQDKATIEAILTRRTCFSRKAAGEPARRQLVAANIDTVLLVCGLDADFNLRRIERYLVAIRHSGADPVLVLNKADRCRDTETPRAAVAELAPQVPIHVIGALEAGGTDVLRQHLPPGKTGALIGSSGVGKSTIINSLLGNERQRTRAVRGRDRRGRHTTTQRELIPLPDGGLLIDTPGMRELQLWEGDDALDDAFDDILALAAACRFRDCEHDREPGCAVRLAVEQERLTSARLGNYRKLSREGLRLRKRLDEQARLETHREVKGAHRAMRAMRHNRLGPERKS
ncbi:MAG: ribosome small subunit-dependent GTPase A [Acidobacteriota bacterium]|nr:ribosome small subunit-dependent GTPase A [Acidobacteriota bacterium]